MNFFVPPLIHPKPGSSQLSACKCLTVSSRVGTAQGREGMCVGGGGALMCGVCRFPQCKHSHRGRSQAANLMSLNQAGKRRATTLSRAGSAGRGGGLQHSAGRKGRALARAMGLSPRCVGTSPGSF